MQSKLLNRGPEKTFAVVLAYGEDPMDEIRKFATKEMLQACRFTAVGAFSEATVGFLYGGHLIKAVTHPTLEIILTESPSWMQRKMDPVSGIPLIQL